MSEAELTAIVEQFQAENERLREEIARFRLNPPKWWEAFNIQDVQDILQDNYFWIGVAVGAIAAIVYGIAPFFVRRNTRER